MNEFEVEGQPVYKPFWVVRMDGHIPMGLYDNYRQALKGVRRHAKREAGGWWATKRAVRKAMWGFAIIRVDGATVTSMRDEVWDKQRIDIKAAATVVYPNIRDPK